MDAQKKPGNCFDRFTSALLTWLALFDAAAGLAGWRGLVWSSGRLRGLPALALLLPALQRERRPRAVGLGLALLPALGLQFLLATLRRHRHNPRQLLIPGDYADRRITRLDIPTATGPVPALAIEPLTEAVAAVCVAHGSGCNKTFYAWRLVEALVAQRMAVYLIDLDGHGESPRPQDYPAIIENVGGTVRWLRTRYNRVAAIGISLGGAVAGRAAADGAPLEALVLLEAPARLRLTVRDIRRIQVFETLSLLRPAVLDLLAEGSPYHVIRAWESPRIRARIGTWDLFDRLDLLGSLKRLGHAETQLPLLLIYAGSDAIVSRKQAALVRAHMPAWAEYHMRPRASHISLPIERVTIRIVADWLAQQVGAARKVTPTD